MKKLASFVLAMMLIATTTFSTFAVEYGVEIQNAPTKNYTQKFTDVPTDHWAFKYIGEMIERKVFAGYPDGKFRPSNTITRAEFAKIIISADNIIMDINDDIMYSDVTTEHWARPFINNAAIYMTGYNVQGRLEFRPESNALREDIAVALVKLKGYDTSSADIALLQSMFTDYEGISQSARKYVAVAVERGLISGYEDETFRAQQSITRAEASVLLWRAYQYGSDNKVVSEKAPEVIEITPLPIQTSKPVGVITPPPATTEPTATPTLAPTPTPKPTPEPGTWSSRTVVSYKGSFSPIQDMQYTEGFVYVSSGKGISAYTLNNGCYDMVQYSDIKLNDQPINVVKSAIGINYNSNADTRVFFGVTTDTEFILYVLAGENQYVQIGYTTEIKGSDLDKILFLDNNDIVVVAKNSEGSSVYKVDISDVSMMKLFSTKNMTIFRVTDNKFFGWHDQNGASLIDISGAVSEGNNYGAMMNKADGDATLILHKDTFYPVFGEITIDYTDIIIEDNLPIKYENIKFPRISRADNVLIFWDSAYKCIRAFKQN